MNNYSVMGRKRTRVTLMPPAQPLKGSSLTEEKIGVLRRCFEAGLNVNQACRLAGISTSTYQRATSQNPDFKAEMDNAALNADVMVISALQKKASGFVQEVEELKTVSIGDGMSSVEKHKRLKYFEPDTRAAELWLTNRQPDKWKKTQEINMKAELSDMSDEDLDAKLAAMLANQAANEPE